MDKKFTCPICGKHTFECDNDYAKCPVCFWWNDIVQNRRPDYDGGANEMSQNEYRKNWLAETNKIITSSTNVTRKKVTDDV